MGNFLVPFKKFLSNKNTITILGVLIGLVVLYLGYSWRVTQSVQPTEIPICNQTLLAGTKITNDYIGFTRVPKSMVNNMGNLKTNVSDIVGKLVSYDGKIPQNSFFFGDNLIEEKDMPNSIFSNIQDGYTVYDLKIDGKDAYGNAIFPDSTIDLYLSSEDTEEGKVMFGRLIKQIRVLAVWDDDGKSVFANKDNPTKASLLLFAVPENLFLLLKKAEKLGIEIEPVVRNDSYSENAGSTELVNDELQAHIINQTYILSNECQDLTLC